jgi:hypothetical protein
MKKFLIFLFPLILVGKVFSYETKNFNCGFDKWFDTPIDTIIFFSLTKTEKGYVDGNGKQFVVRFEDNSLISLVSNTIRPETDVIVINKLTKKITKSLTQDNLVTVIKGNCK